MYRYGDDIQSKLAYKATGTDRQHAKRIGYNKEQNNKHEIAITLHSVNNVAPSTAT